jgi:hypothetical protein
MEQVEKKVEAIEFINKFPRIDMKFNYITNDKDYELFEEGWLNLYKENKEFHFNIDVTNIMSANIKYAFKLSSFINFIKKNIKVQYLKYSIIIVNSTFVKYLLNILFTLSSPVAPVYIINKDDYYIKIHEDIENNKKIEKAIYVTP